MRQPQAQLLLCNRVCQPPQPPESESFSESHRDGHSDSRDSARDSDFCAAVRLGILIHVARREN